MHGVRDADRRTETIASVTTLSRPGGIKMYEQFDKETASTVDRVAWAFTRTGQPCRYVMDSAYYPDRVILFSINGQKRFYESRVDFEKYYK